MAARSAVWVAVWCCQATAADFATIYAPPAHLEEQGGFSSSDLELSRPRRHAVELSWPPGPDRERAGGTLSLRHGVPSGSSFAWGSVGAQAQDGPAYGHMVFKGSALIISFEVAMMGVMMMLPRDAMNWEPDFVQDAARNLGRHLTSAPVWDEDDWRLNYLGHPYAGSIYYNTVRSQGASFWQSFFFTVGASTFWEYVVEATAEPASTQDLIVTPVAGALLGELVHRLTESMTEDGTSLLEGIAILILNPTHVVMRGYR